MLYGEMYTNAPSSSPWSYVRTAASRCTRHSTLTTAFPKSRFVKIQMSTSDLYRREWLVCTPRDNARCGLLWGSNVTEGVAKRNCYPIRSQGEAIRVTNAVCLVFCFWGRFWRNRARDLQKRCGIPSIMETQTARIVMAYTNSSKRPLLI